MPMNNTHSHHKGKYILALLSLRTCIRDGSYARTKFHVLSLTSMSQSQACVYTSCSEKEL